MPINADKPDLWKADVERSIDFYNDWFLRFAPETYRNQRYATSEQVEDAFAHTDFLRNLSPSTLKSSPGILAILRMACTPPIARDRLMGLAHVGKNLIQSMEGKENSDPRIPPRMKEEDLDEQLGRICEIIFELADRDLCPWLEEGETPNDDATTRASTVVADRLCGAMTDPIIRNAQEQRQLTNLRNWLESRGYKHVESRDIRDFPNMQPGTFTFRLNIEVGRQKTTIPVDAVIQPFGKTGLPVLIEAKSAGDATNTNKRRKEEAQKFNQLKQQFGSVKFILFLCGYFEPGYLGYEASEGIDWVWEHRISDFNSLFPESDSCRSTCEGVGEDSPAYTSSLEQKEALRFQHQIEMDNSRDPLSRNVLGQFSTPFFLAQEMVDAALKDLHTDRISFIEPAVGAGVFISALQSKVPDRITEGIGVEIDSGYANIAKQLWNNPYTILNNDFLEISKQDKFQSRFNFLCTNPPYVRHHHIDGALKKDLQERIQDLRGLKISGLSGLYVYFILLAHNLLEKGAVASWLIPSEFLSVNYGEVLRRYLLTEVTLLRIHRFSPQDVQFDDALVSSCIVTYKKEKPSSAYPFDYSFGGNLEKPTTRKTVSSDDTSLSGKWSFTDAIYEESDSAVLLGDLFSIKRGIATGANGYFILDGETAKRYKIPKKFLKPILPSPRYLKEDIIEDNGGGYPSIEKINYLLDCDLPPEMIEKNYPGFWSYLQLGEEKGIPENYICSHRKPWYQQEKRDPPLFLATYMGRSNNPEKSPFRFILNQSNAVATNVFLFLYPTAFLKKQINNNPARTKIIFEYLNLINPLHLIRNGRTYGGGLHKLEPKELLNLPLPNLPDWLRIEKHIQQPLPL